MAAELQLRDIEAITATKGEGPHVTPHPRDNRMKAR
jgi:hypothetical protein